MGSEAIMIWSVLFGGIGIGFFMYGKKQRAVVPLFTGLALFIYPYFMTSVTMLIIVGIILIALPYFIRL
ncbi:MAG: hypothetical protein JKX78_14045 [Alteromonadaceae bacterium]|nr:hypothetical protein [Alteromonadaceae bacterium]